MTRHENKSRAELLQLIARLEQERDALRLTSPTPERAPRFREKYSLRILDSLPDMLTVLNHQANVIELASAPWTNHVEGTDEHSIVGANLKNILPAAAYEQIRKNMDTAIATGKNSVAMHTLMVNGTPHRYENRICPLDGERLLCVCRDITPQWKAEEVNRQQQKELEAARDKAQELDRMKSAFLANISHEIRTPLNAIVGFSKLVAESTDETERRQYADIIEQNSETLLTLVHDVLDLAALEADSLQFNIRPVRLIDICLQLVQQYGPKTKERTSLILDGVDAEVYVLGDWDRIVQVVSNLLSNAIKFTHSGEIHFGYHEKGEFAEFYVQDTGIGISAQKAATIFQRFGKVDNFVQGSGLGLTICRLLVAKMGGHIWLRSQQGEGSHFFFTLPLVRL